MCKRLDMKGVVKTYSMNIEQQKSKVYRFLFYSLSQTSFILFLCHLLSQFKGFAKPQGQFVCTRFAGRVVQIYKYSSYLYYTECSNSFGWYAKGIYNFVHSLIAILVQLELSNFGNSNEFRRRKYAEFRELSLKICEMKIQSVL